MLNLGCPGETTSTFIAGGCPYPTSVPNSYDGYPMGSSSQLEAALTFIHAHPGRVRYVTILLGIANVNGGAPNTPWCQVTTTDATTLRQLDTDLHTILSRLRAGLGRTGTIIALNYYDAFQNRCSHASAKQPASVVTLDAHIARAAAPSHVPVADLFAAFGGHSAPNRQLCRLTYVCGPDLDPHPTPAGQALIASVLVRLLNRLHP
jgi:lysophospholipase L1-like esterase